MNVKRNFLMITVIALLTIGSSISIYFSLNSRYVNGGDAYVIDTETGFIYRGGERLGR